MQTIVSPGVTGGAGLGGTTTGLGFLPQAELAIRYGVTDNIEFAAKAWLVGVGTELKIGLMESPTMDSGIDLSLNPSFAYFGLNAGSGDTAAGINSFTLGVPVLVGFNMGGHQLVLGPKVINQLLIASGSTGGTGGSAMVDILSVGTTVGYALKLGDEFRLLPEIAILYPLAAFGSAGGQTGGGLTQSSGVTLQIGVGIMFGGKYENASEAVSP
jgi:hypothetical protein